MKINILTHFLKQWLFCFILFLFSTQIYAQDTLVVDSNNGEFGVLNATIAGDTTDTGERVHKVYELKRGQTYILNGAIEHRDYHLIIVAEEGDGPRPILQPGVGDGGVSDRPFRARGDLTLQGLFVTGENQLGGLEERIIRVSADDVRIELMDCEFDRDSQTLLRLDNEGNSIFINNCIISRMGTPNDADNGRVVDDRGNQVDTLVMESNTMYNITSRIIRDGGSVINYAKFNNNTVFSVGQRVCDFGEVATLEMKNNIIVNPTFLGAEQDFLEGSTTELDPEDLPLAAIIVDSLDSESGLTQSITISNNNIFTNQELLDARPGINPDPEDNDTIVSRPIFSPTALNFIEASGTGDTNIEEVLVFTNSPVIPTVFVEQFWADFEGNGDQDPWDMTDAPYDLGYFEQAISATAADDGGKLGDSRWSLTLTGLPGLEAKIIESQEILDEASEGGNIGEYPATAKTALQTAIDAAQIVLDDNTTTNEQADVALTTLTSDLETFMASVVTGLDEELLAAGVQLFPNPAIERITISNLDKTTVHAIKIFDTSGKVMYQNYKKISGELNIDLSSFSAGIYIMKLSQANGKLNSLKFVKN